MTGVQQHIHRWDRPDASARPAPESRGNAGTAEDPRTNTDSGTDEGMSFWDLLDVVNPLQHIPLVNRAYRAITGDEIKPAAQLAGSTLFFGPVGTAVAGADLLLAHETGKDSIGHVASLLGLDGDDPADAGPPPVQYAQTAPAAPDRVIPRTAADLPPALAAFARDSLAQAESAGRQTPDTADARERQVRQLQGTPGAGAAAVAAAGLTPQAVLGSLGAPGSPGDVNGMAALMQQDRAEAKTPGGGKGMADYWRLAEAGSPAQPRNIVPPPVNQQVQGERGWHPTRLPGGTTAPAASAGAGTGPLVPGLPIHPDLAAEKTGMPVERKDTDRDTRQWPPGGPPQLPPALIADMMLGALDKYEAMKRTQPAGPADRQRVTADQM